MFLGAYRFHGDPAELFAAHDRLSAEMPVDATDLHICVETTDGIAVLDACPTKPRSGRSARAPSSVMPAGALAYLHLPSNRSARCAKHGCANR